MTGPHFHPNFLYVPFFRFHYLQNGVQLPSICSLWELEFAQWCRFYLLLIDQKLLRGGGGPLRSYINNTQLVSFFSFSSFISQYVVCLHVLLWLPGGGLGWQEEILTCVPNPCNTTPFEW
jgi:hypothetical protein